MPMDPAFFETAPYAFGDPDAFAASFLETFGFRYPSGRRVLERLVCSAPGERASLGSGERRQGPALVVFAAKLAEHVDDPGWVRAAVATLAASHPEIELPRDLPEWLTEVLLETRARVEGRDWAGEVRAAWCETVELDRVRSRCALS